MIIKILGTGCKNCQTLEKNVKEALQLTNQSAEIVKVTNIMDIQKYGILRTPGLVIDEKVVLSGRVPKSKEITHLFK
ncbi:small redox-active disulfide protein 2 [Enterococcus sp. PF1-24]|uniref:thioredoxin family protein n=1 Tax=unclassified Enterococcus TaxID=2608891 RepID=UPI002476EB31|nr:MULTISPECIES: thioredoxin family protein [unclassified Enterococcus]MDH6365848.1 small redox-active disulfide protein 2 [Enterococcus sp. PFB1-1]MDH6402940.1 small redox-active disulfide protein 2 [Enterococcus sp. PF1-24]